MERKCLECGDTLRGRIDKKFCSDQCRNAYNNKYKGDYNNYVKKINYILRKNRRILAEFNPDGKSKIHRTRLLEQGFNFSYYTNTFITKNGNVYYFCYDQGYLPIDNNFFALVHRQEYVS